MSRRTRTIIAIIVVVLVVITTLGYVFRSQLLAWVFGPTSSTIPSSQVANDRVETIKTGLTTPWSISFLPSGDSLVTERSGQIRQIGNSGKTFTINGVRETSEGGLLGLAVHPEFQSNRMVYVYYTTDKSGVLTNQVDQYKLVDNSLTFVDTILSGIPAATNHDGGALAFGPDEKLYVTTGDASVSDNAQDKTSLAGKILRLNDDGSIPNDNPFDSPVWSYGHRNPQGIAWDEQDRLWSVEHGPSGADTGRDELNRIERGGNYGWPVITGDETRDGMITPVAQSGISETWAPAGLAYAEGSLYFSGLRGQSLYQAKIKDDGDSVTLSRHFVSQFGRLRAVSVYGPNLYMSTSNRDGRGSPRDGDDKILRVSINMLNK